MADHDHMTMDHSDPDSGHSIADHTDHDHTTMDHPAANADLHAGHDHATMSAADPHAGHDHKTMDPADPHAGHSMTDHAGHEQLFRRKFWVSLLLSIPVLWFSAVSYTHL